MTGRKPRKLFDDWRERINPHDSGACEPPLAIDALCGRSGAAHTRFAQEPRTDAVLDLAGRVAQVSDPVLLAGWNRQPVRVADRPRRRATALIGDRPDH